MPTFRVTVRGRFADLTTEQRARLVADAPAHDLLVHGRFSEAGTLSYEPTLHAFTFGYQLTSEADDPGKDVVERAESMAMAALIDLEVDWAGLRTSATDVTRQLDARR